MGMDDLVPGGSLSEVGHDTGSGGIAGIAGLAGPGGLSAGSLPGTSLGGGFNLHGLPPR